MKGCGIETREWKLLDAAHHFFAQTAESIPSLPTDFSLPGK
jgi:hypothetical protein